MSYLTIVISGVIATLIVTAFCTIKSDRAPLYIDVDRMPERDYEAEKRKGFAA
jgi:hypothetical protein